ncbi:uncharacterized protein PG998_012310 [Apiospora kogelbergensis]|uniref:uncharacterized protein n=1 Tax=Apiospora kogelbergensis TaxID=1337665 RepID=UPI00312F541B
MESNTTTDLPVLIIGAGVAGLTLAQGLRLRSVPFRLFERHTRLHNAQGHRFRISGQGRAALNSVLSPQLQSLLQRTAPEIGSAPRYVDARKLDFPDPAPADPEAMPLDRSWIRALTLLGIADAVEYEKAFEAYDIVDGQVRAKFTDGSVVLGQFLVGADGIQSRVRKQLQPDRKLLDLERCVMWGRTPLTEAVRARLRPELLSWCMYHDYEANVQAVVDPMIWAKSGLQELEDRLPEFSNYVYWVVCTAPGQYSAVLPKTTQEKKYLLGQVTKTWHPDLKLLFDLAAHELSACAPVLSSKPDIELRLAGQTGRVTLVGDAAHPMSPMGGSGADTAIRNAADLALTIAEKGVTKKSMIEYETRMEERAKVKVEHSFRGGQKFWHGKEWTEYAPAAI